MKDVPALTRFACLALALLALAGLLAACGPAATPSAPSPAATTPAPATRAAAATRSASPTPVASPTGAASATAASATAASATPAATAGPAGEVAVRLELLADGLERPLYLTHAGDGSERLFVVEQAGRIRTLAADGALAPEPLLDIRERVSSGGERGLLSVAFSPDFAADRAFYVDYTDLNGDTVIARYQLVPGQPGEPPRADPASATTILAVDQPAANHNGGQIVFGPDGYLYVAFGDGGGGNSRNGQALDTLLGKLLRLDVARASAGQPYAIPPDNPFVADPAARPEIWAYGLRNPWRFSFDRATGDLYIADVGSSTYEEISFQPGASAGGENYGWDLAEGDDCRAGPGGCAGLVAPIVAYGRGEGDCVVVGGYVYRGARYPQLQGTYFFGDYCSGRIWSFAAADVASGRPAYRLLLDSELRIASFGEDEAGELVVVDLSGAVYRLAAAP
jgi:glucose/arabinose dehydrogenase